MAANTFDAVMADIKARKFAPVYMFCGEEAYFIDLLTEAIENGVLNDMEKAFNFTVLYGEDSNARQIIETAGRLPMMAEKQVVIVREAQALSMKEAEELQYVNYLKKPVSSTILVFAWKYGKPDGRKSFGKLLLKDAVFVECAPLKENQIAAWIKKWITDKGFKIEQNAADLLTEYAGTNLSSISNELEKLIINKAKGTAITLDDIEQQVGVSKDYNSFELCDALGAKKRSKVYKIVNHFAANPKSGPMPLVLGTLQNYFVKLYQLQTGRNLSDNELAGLMKVAPFVVGKTREVAKLYPIEKVEAIFELLSEYDLRSKGLGSSGVKDGELLKELTFRILH